VPRDERKNIIVLGVNFSKLALQVVIASRGLSIGAKKTFVVVQFSASIVFQSWPNPVLMC